MAIIEKINTPDDLRKLTYDDKNILAEEIRKLMLHTVSKTGGHLASNLGIVELTIALDSVFHMPKDKIVWDVGHQTYVHKILTGRKDQMDTLRKLDGIAGFPKTTESPYDVFNTGHSSTSISAALGMARARDLKKEKNYVIAVIGDGALTGGMALEALNDAGSSKTNLIVVLNDNEMSIAKNVGGISHFLTRIRTRKLYNKSNRYIKKAVSEIPKVGNGIIKLVRRVKYSIKQLVIPNMLFEDFGFKYLGPVDGHHIEDIEEILKKAKDLEGPILIHVLTTKGKGYEPAEMNPDKYHSTASFDIDTGKPITEKKDDYSKVFGTKLVELAKKDKKIVAITAAMTDGTGLSEFAKKFPKRFFDVGIAEQHGLTMAAGLAACGVKPVISIYSSFYQRGYDQVIHDICMQNLPVVMCIDRAGIVGNDGETHQGVFDMAFFRFIPNITIMAPKDFRELEDMLEFALRLNRPVAIRYPRGGQGSIPFTIHEKIKLGKAEIVQGKQEGNFTILHEETNSINAKSVCIIGIGKMVARAVEVAKILEEQNIYVQVMNARFLKPFDEKTVLDVMKQSAYGITIEDGCILGGLGTTVKELVIENHLPTKIESFAYPDEYIRHGSVEELEKMYGMDAKSIAEKIIKLMRNYDE